jgi:hypothetical protein
MAEGKHLQIKRGIVSTIGVLSAGEPGWATDTKVLYIGDGATNNAVLMASQATAAGLALMDDANAAAQIATLGLDADIATLALPANTTISAAGAELINDADATAQIATLGAVATGDSRLSDARPASDVYAWAKAASKPAYTAAEVGIKAGSVTTNAGAVTVVAHGLGTTPASVVTTSATAEYFGVTAKSSTTFTLTARSTATLVYWIAVA